jgi:hypothetical protein
MSLAESNRVGIAYAKETVFGDGDLTSATTMRLTSESLVVDKATETSKEIRSDRNISDVIEVGASSGGSVDGELSLTTYDEFFESALCGLPGATTDFSGSATFTASSSDIVSVGAFADVVVGQYIEVQGSSEASNNGWHLVVARASDDLVQVSSSLVDASDTVTIKGTSIKNGVTQTSFAFEKAFNDVSVYEKFVGMRLGKMTVEATAKQIATLNFEFMGTSAEVGDSSFVSSLGAPTSSEVVNATTDMGCVQVDGAVSDTPIQKVSVSIDNKLRQQDAVCTKYAVGIGYGQLEVTGSLTAYFKNRALLDIFLNHTDIAISFGFRDSAGNALRVTVPSAKITSNPVAASGIDTDIMQELDFTAKLDPVTGCQIQIDLA